MFSQKSMQRRGRILVQVQRNDPAPPDSGPQTHDFHELPEGLAAENEACSLPQKSVKPACSSALHLADSQHCKALFHITEELPSACADNLMRSTSKTFIVMNHIAMNSPAVGGGPDLEMAQCPVHLLSDT